MPGTFSLLFETVGSGRLSEERLRLSLFGTYEGFSRSPGTELKLAERGSSALETCSDRLKSCDARDGRAAEECARGKVGLGSKADVGAMVMVAMPL